MGDLSLIAISAIITFIIMIVITSKRLRKIIKKILNVRIFKTKILVKNVLAIGLILIIEIYSVNLLMRTGTTMEFATSKDEYHEKINKESKQVINSQNKKLKELMKTETNIENCKNPYIPEGFKYVEGEWNSGFVIEDENQNQFVWVPCTNLENDENIPIIRKENFMKDNTSQSYFECYEETGFENFIESLLENGGFYIARFEMSNENGNPVSKAGKEVWVDINYTDANKLARNMYDNINSRLLNGFAYDIAIRFMLDEIDMGNVPKGTGITGNSVYKNIYDLIDDYGEWTEEQKYGSRIFRRTVFYEDEMLFCDRFTDDEDATHSILGFRTIIYK